MKQKTGILLAAIWVVLVVGVYLGRGYIKDAWSAYRAPKLPQATSFHPKAVGSSDTGLIDQTNSPFEGGYSTSQHYALETQPQRAPQKDPLAFTGTLPTDVNLDVPFTSQAPTGDWSLPFQEACEETASFMVDGYYQGLTGRIPPAAAENAIRKTVAYEDATFGFYKDTNAEQTASFIRGLYGYKNVIVKPLDSVDDIKRPLALGYPVIIPFAGKLLHNPNFRGDGPLYHMLVMRGYTKDFFITNDPGTRNGMGYTYDYNTIMTAAHDWNAGDVTNGKRVMIVVLPN